MDDDVDAHVNGGRVMWVSDSPVGMTKHGFNAHVVVVDVAVDAHVVVDVECMWMCLMWLLSCL